MLESGLESVEIVELDDARSFRGVDRRADVSAARLDYVALQGGEGFIDCAVVAVMEDQDFCALGDFAGDADSEAIGVGGGESELPVRESEAALQFFADPDGVLGGEHEGDAFA